MKCGDLSAGKLRTPCQFQVKSKIGDGAGGWRETWVNMPASADRCQFKMLGGGERWQAQRAEATTRNRIVTRYFAGLTEAHRVSVAGRVYNITAIDNLEMRNRWLVIDLDGGVAT